MPLNLQDLETLCQNPEAARAVTAQSLVAIKEALLRIADDLHAIRTKIEGATAIKMSAFDDI